MSDKLVKLTGQLFWPKLQQPVYNKYKKKNLYSTLFQPDPKSLKKLEDMGVPDTQLFDRDDKHTEGKTITLQKDAKTPQGKPLRPPKVVGEDGKLMEDAEASSIGNGTKAEVVVSVYFSEKWSGRPVIRLLGVRITDLVKYESGKEIMDMLGVEDFAPETMEDMSDESDKSTEEDPLEDLDDDIPF